MKKVFLDTNILLRYILDDNDSQVDEVEILFHKCSRGEIELYINSIVLFEIKWVLSSYYKLTKEKVIMVLNGIVEDLNFIKYDEQEIMNYAIFIYMNENIDLEDAYYISWAYFNNFNELKTFDKKLSNLFNDKYNKR